MQPTGKSIHVLYVDSNPDSVEDLFDTLEREDDRIAVENVPSASEALGHLEQETPDCIVSEYELSGENGIAFLKAVREKYPDLPFILYTENGNEQVASEAISAGVTEYLQRTTDYEGAGRLATQIASVVREYRSGDEDDSSHHRLEQILKTVPGCVVKLDTTGRFIYANQRAEEVLGLERSAVTERTYNDPAWNIKDLDGNPIPDEELPFRRVLDAGEPVYGLQHKIQWLDGTEKILRVSGAPLFDSQGNIESVVFSLTDITERKEREKQLAETNTVLRTIVENLPSGVLVEDVDRDILMVNETLSEVLDVPIASDDLIGRDCETAAKEIQDQFADPEEFITGINERITHGDPVQNEELRLADDRVLERDYVPYTLPDGEADLWLYRDITERKKRERELERARQIIQKSTDIATVIAPDGTITYVSPAVERVLGYEPEELIGNGGFEYQPPETSEAVADAIEHVLENPDETQTVQTRFRRADGSWCWIESTLRNKLDEDMIEGILVSSREITKRKERERKLERKKTFLEQSPVAIAVVDEGGKITYQSPTSEQVVGLSAEEFIDDVAFEYIHPDDRTEVVELFSELVENSGESRTAEYRLENGDGNWQWMQSTAINYLDEPAIGGILIATFDITERKEYEQRVEEQRDNLETVNQVVRHDIRNGLQLVSAYTDLLADHIEEGSDRYEYVEKIQESVGHAVELTRTAREMTDVMLTSDDNQKQVPLQNPLTTELDEVRAAYSEAAITIEGDVPAVDVLADEMLGSVFRNLLTNAIQHNDKPVAEVTVAVEDRTDTVRVRVADNGPGVPDGQKKEIFGKGEKGLNSEGTGIGLHLVQTLVVSYGGDVWVTDNDPVGAVFVVELPKAS